MPIPLELEHAKLLERFELAARATNDGFWDWDMVTNTAWWSETFYDRFGIDRSVKPSHQGWVERVHPDDRERVLASFQAALARGDASWSDEYRFVTPAGEVLDSFDRAYIIYDEAGSPIRMGGALMDITARRKLEAQLRHAQKMDAMGQLAGGIAHDFNNALQAITLAVQLMKVLPDLPSRAAQIASDVEAAAERAASLARQLLVFSRREPMRAAVHELDEVVADLARMLHRVLGEHIALQLQLGSGGAHVRVDRGMLDQLLLNLALNARDAMPDGGSLTIATSIARDATRMGAHVCIIVRDTGVGIPGSVLPRIFEPFFTTKPRGKGTGLGLAIAFGIVQQHGGWIDVDSEPGCGATFRTYLPVADEVSQPPPERVSSPSLVGQETVMLVEDDEHVRRVIHQLLTQYGYRVVEADNGVAALGVWDREEGRIDLVLTDLAMPGGLDGSQLASELERRQPGVRIVFATGHRRDLELREHHKLLHKPIGAENLLAAIRASLDA